MLRRIGLPLSDLLRNVAQRLSPSARRLLRDPYTVYTAWLIPILVAIGLVSPATDAGFAVVSGIGALIAQGVLSRVRRERWRAWQTRWSLLRLAVPVALVSLILYKGGSASAPVALLYLPIVVAAAALGWVQAAIIGAGAVVLYIGPTLGDLAARDEAAVRGVALAGVSVVVTIATRRMFSTLSRAVRDHRAAVVAERRLARRIRGLEAINRLLATAGPTDQALDGVVGELANSLGYPYVSMFLRHGDVLRMRAQRGYRQLVGTFDGRQGVIGRVMRTRESALVRDVRVDPDYVIVEPSIRSLICAPMLVDQELLGVLCIESEHQLNRTDHDLLRSVAYRLGTAIALGRDRQALTERVELLELLRRFTASTATAPDLQQLYERTVAAASEVVGVCGAALVAADEGSPAQRVRAAAGERPAAAVGELLPDTVLLARPISADGASPAGDRDPTPHLALPLASGKELVGILVITLRAGVLELPPLQHEGLALLATHAALAITNHLLFRRTAEEAVRDSLTGLHNRRYFDEAFAQVLAGRRRHFRRLALVLFDLDRFGELNKRHGHQVGDGLLRAFAGVLQGRVRATDLVARFGGEEFVLVLPEASIDDARAVAEEIRAIFRERAVVTDAGPVGATVSAGCSEATAGDTPEELIRRADVALYMAKRAGRDQVVAA